MEMIGTFFLVLTIALTASNPDIAPMAPLAIGGVLMVMVYAGGFISGAHYNPAVTIGLLLRKKISVINTGAYILAQLIAGVLALVLASIMLGDVAGIVPDAIDGQQAFIAELVFTFALVTVILHTAASKQVDGNSYFGLAIGMTVMAGAYAVGGISGGAFNPAVTLAYMFQGADSMDYVGIYVGAQVVGGLLAALVHGVTTSK